MAQARLSPRQQVRERERVAAKATVSESVFHILQREQENPYPPAVAAAAFSKTYADMFSCKEVRISVLKPKQMHQTVPFTYNGTHLTVHESGMSLLPVSPCLDLSRGPSHRIHSLIAEEDFTGIVSLIKELNARHKADSIQPEKGKIQTNFENMFNSFGSQDDFDATPLMLLARTLKEGELLTVLKKLDEAQRGRYRINIKEIVNKRDRDGRTVLHYAYALGLENAANKLKELGSAHDIRDKDDRTAEELAATMTQDSVNKMLADLEMHPHRDTSAPSNCISERVNPVMVVIGDRAFYLLHSKEVLTAICAAKDFAREFTRVEQLHLLDCLDKCTGISIGEQCFRNVRRMRGERVDVAAAADVSHQRHY